MHDSELQCSIVKQCSKLKRPNVAEEARLATAYTGRAAPPTLLDLAIHVRHDPSPVVGIHEAMHYSPQLVLSANLLKTNKNYLVVNRRHR